MTGGGGTTKYKFKDVALEGVEAQPNHLGSGSIHHGYQDMSSPFLGTIDVDQPAHQHQQHSNSPNIFDRGRPQYDCITAHGQAEQNQN